MISAVGVIVGGAFTVYSYLDTRQLEAEARRIEARRPFVERQLQTYSEINETIAKLLSAPKRELRRQAEQEFWRLYWGNIRLTADPSVLGALNAFASALDDSKPSKELKALHTVLVSAFRTSLATAWNITDWSEPRVNIRSANRPH